MAEKYLLVRFYNDCDDFREEGRDGPINPDELDRWLESACEMGLSYTNFKMDVELFVELKCNDA